MDFSNAFTDGAGPPPRRPNIGNKPKIGNKPVLSRKPNLSRSHTAKNAGNKRTGTPIVKTTRAMEMRKKMNEDKQAPLARSRTGQLGTIRERTYGKYTYSYFIEESFGRPRRNSPMQRSLRKPWQTNSRNQSHEMEISRGHSPVRARELQYSDRKPFSSIHTRTPPNFVKTKETNFANTRNDRSFDDRPFANRRHETNRPFENRRNDNNRPFQDTSRQQFQSRQFIHKSPQKSTLLGNNNFPKQGRVSDVSMRSATPTRGSNIHQNNNFNQRNDQYGNIERNENINPFKSERDNIFSNQTLQQPPMKNPFDAQPVMKFNPFAHSGQKLRNDIRPTVVEPVQISNAQKHNPFSKSMTIPKNFNQNKSNPFAKQSTNKENVTHNVPRPVQQMTYKAVVHAPIAQFGNDSALTSVQQPSVVKNNNQKSRKQLIAEVMEYFLHSKILDTLGSKQTPLELEDSEITEIQ